MSSSFPPNPNNLLPDTFPIPDDPEEMKIKLYQYLNDLAIKINQSVYGIFSTLETKTGKKFIPIYPISTAPQFPGIPTGDRNAVLRDVFRVAIDTGTLPSSTTSSTAHGITTTEDFSIIDIYGGATDPGASTITSGIPLPYINTTTPGDSVQVEIDATNINITTTTANYTSYTRSFIVIEYIKEVA